MRLCRTASPQLRASQVDLLLTIAMNPGRTQTELAHLCDLTISAVSRAVDVLGASGRRDGRGGKLGLIEAKRNPDDDRIVQIYLTSKGEHFVSLLEALINGSPLSA